MEARESAAPFHAVEGLLQPATKCVVGPVGGALSGLFEPLSRSEAARAPTGHVSLGAPATLGGLFLPSTPEADLPVLQPSGARSALAAVWPEEPLRAPDTQEKNLPADALAGVLPVADAGSCPVPGPRHFLLMRGEGRERLDRFLLPFGAIPEAASDEELRSHFTVYLLSQPDSWVRQHAASAINLGLEHALVRCGLMKMCAVQQSVSSLKRHMSFAIWSTEYQTHRQQLNYVSSWEAPEQVLERVVRQCVAAEHMRRYLASHHAVSQGEAHDWHAALMAADAGPSTLPREDPGGAAAATAAPNPKVQVPPQDSTHQSPSPRPARELSHEEAAVPAPSSSSEEAAAGGAEPESLVQLPSLTALAQPEPGIEEFDFATGRWLDTNWLHGQGGSAGAQPIPHGVWGQFTAQPGHSSEQQSSAGPTSSSGAAGGAQATGSPSKLHRRRQRESSLEDPETESASKRPTLPSSPIPEAPPWPHPGTREHILLVGEATLASLSALRAATLWPRDTRGGRDGPAGASAAAAAAAAEGIIASAGLALVDLLSGGPAAASSVVMMPEGLARPAAPIPESEGLLEQVAEGPPLVSKLWLCLNSGRYDSIVSFGTGAVGGHLTLIRDLERFEAKVLQRVSKSLTWRQVRSKLLFLGFHASDQSEDQRLKAAFLYHPYFVKGRPDLLRFIKDPFGHADLPPRLYTDAAEHRDRLPGDGSASEAQDLLCLADAAQAAGADEVPSEQHVGASPSGAGGAGRNRNIRGKPQRSCFLCPKKENYTKEKGMWRKPNAAFAPKEWPEDGNAWLCHSCWAFCRRHPGTDKASRAGAKRKRTAGKAHW